MDSRTICNEFVEKFNREFGTKVKIVPKEPSKVMKILAVIVWLFNRKFMTNYVTTLDATIYTPKTFWDPEHTWESRLVTIWHECVHGGDSKKFLRVFFALSYLFPQILAPVLLGLGIGFQLPWWVCLIGVLVPFIPVLIPAPFRIWWEMRGYRTTVFWWEHVWKTPISSPAQRHIFEKFFGPDYYWMGTILQGWVRKLLGDTHGAWTQERVYQILPEFLREKGLHPSP